MFLDHGFTAEAAGENGTVRLAGAHIGGQLSCSVVALTNRLPGWCGVVARDGPGRRLGPRGLSQALASWRKPLARHDPGKIVTNLVLALAVGGDCLVGMAVLRAESSVFGRVASDPTVSRLVDTLATDADRALKAIAAARAAARARVWAAAGQHSPDHGASAETPVVTDVDTTLVTAQSDKEQAAPTFKKGFGWRQDTSRAAEPRALLSRRALRWASEAIVCQHLTIARVAEALAVSWDTANDAVLAEGRRVLISDPHRPDGVLVIGVDEHAWRHTRRGDKYVTVIFDLTPLSVTDRAITAVGHGLGSLETGVRGVASSTVGSVRTRIEVVAMDGFIGFKPAAAETVPDAVAVMDPFHVVALAGDALDRCQRVQQETCGHGGRTGDPLYGIRPVLRTGIELLTDRQHARLTAVFTDQANIEVEATWGIYQRIVAADPDRAAAKTELAKITNTISAAVPSALTELITLGRTLTRRAADVLAYFDRPRTS